MLKGVICNITMHVIMTVSRRLDKELTCVVIVTRAAKLYKVFTRFRNLTRENKIIKPSIVHLLTIKLITIRLKFLIITKKQKKKK